MTKITAAELAYDLSRIPAIHGAMGEMTEDDATAGRGPAWDALLADAATLMDDDLREEMHDQWSDERSTCDFLAVYAARHEAKFGTPFNF